MPSLAYLLSAVFQKGPPSPSMLPCGYCAGYPHEPSASGLHFSSPLIRPYEVCIILEKTFSSRRSASYHFCLSTSASFFSFFFPLTKILFTKVMLTLSHLCFWEMCSCFFIWTGPLWINSLLILSVRRDGQSAFSPDAVSLCFAEVEGQEHLMLCHWGGGEVC